MMQNRTVIWSICFCLGLPIGVMPVAAEEVDTVPGALQGRSQIRETDVVDAARTVANWQAQIAQSRVQITGVRLENAETGLSLVLETTGELPVPATRSVGNALIVDIPNAALNKNFQQAEPIAGVALISVMTLPGDRVRVAITGTDAPPTVQISSAATGLTFAVSTGTTTAAEQNEEIELVVTGEQEEGYAVGRSSVGTRTDAELRDVPQSIQVVPQQVLEDQGVIRIQDALRNVSGVTLGSEPENIRNEFSPTIRGFGSGGLVIDGIDRSGLGGPTGFGNVERIEVLKGPASVLYGSGEPGGTVNVVTEQPQAESAYELSATVGNFDFYNPTIDFTGPLNSSATILYRLNAAYENSGSVLDSVDRESLSAYPVLRFELSEDTTLTIDGTYTRAVGTPGRGLPAVGTVIPSAFGEISRSQVLSIDPDYERLETEYIAAGYRLEHQFNDDWSINNRFLAAFAEDEGRVLFSDFSADGRTVTRTPNGFREASQSYILQTDLIGRARTGIVEHSLLFGAELSRTTGNNDNFTTSRPFSFSFDIFNPRYGGSIPSPSIQDFDSSFETNTIGVYAQNLLAIGEQVKVLLGGRLDWSETFSEESFEGTTTSSYSSPSATFSPRVGIVYQPIEPVSLYGSWSRSTLPQSGLDRQGDPFVPITGDQFEIGVRGELLNGDLIANLAAYQITRQNDFIPDPVDPDRFQIQVGERRSRGIEFDLSGEPLPGLRLIASYAYSDAQITEDAEGGNQGNQVGNVPRHSGSLWAVYEIQSGDLEGFGFGTGVFLVGDRPGDSENSFELPSYARLDAVLYYRQDRWKVQLNATNLLDTTYFESSNSRNNVYYGAPFTIRGTVSYTF
jgi:iron complex outermembrane recepter protein